LFYFQGNFIDGKLQNPLKNEWFDIINPADETVMSRSAKSGKEDVDAAVQAAKAAQEQWGTTTGAQRAAFLRKLADAVEANADALSIKEASNAGKPLKEAAWDVSDVSVAFRLPLLRTLVSGDSELTVSIKYVIVLSTLSRQYAVDST
jgi:betaine-aldehyde dehydrogenase